VEAPELIMSDNNQTNCALNGVERANKNIIRG
jgi:hypothetical protein